MKERIPGNRLSLRSFNKYLRIHKIYLRKVHLFFTFGCGGHVRGNRVYLPRLQRCNERSVFHILKLDLPSESLSYTHHQFPVQAGNPVVAYKTNGFAVCGRSHNQGTSGKIFLWKIRYHVIRPVCPYPVPHNLLQCTICFENSEHRVYLP